MKTFTKFYSTFLPISIGIIAIPAFFFGGGYILDRPLKQNTVISTKSNENTHKTASNQNQFRTDSLAHVVEPMLAIISKLSDKVSNLDTKISDLDNRLHDLGLENYRLKIKTNQLESTNEQLTNKLASNDIIIGTLKSDNTQLNNIIDELQQKNADLSKRITSLKVAKNTEDLQQKQTNEKPIDNNSLYQRTKNPYGVGM